MRARVLNRQQAEECTPQPGYVVISISTPGDSLANLQEGWEDILRLQFHDVVQAWPDIPDLVLFDEHRANQVHDFIDQHSNKDFLIHCDAGVSRSMAIGVFLRDIHGAELEIVSNQPVDPEAFANCFANRLVIRKLVEKLWLEQLQKGKDDGS